MPARAPPIVGPARRAHVQRRRRRRLPAGRADPDLGVATGCATSRGIDLGTELSDEGRGRRRSTAGPRTCSSSAPTPPPACPTTTRCSRSAATHGVRTDTIMLLRVDPSSTRADAALAPPRPLRADRRHRRASRINAAIQGGPGRLVATVTDALDLPVHHYVEVDFAGFRDLVEAHRRRARVLPRAGPRPPAPASTCPTPAASPSTPTRPSPSPARAPTRCSGAGGGSVDGTGDLGRISRQQDFIRRALHRAFQQGARNPTVLARPDRGRHSAPSPSTPPSPSADLSADRPAVPHLRPRRARHPPPPGHRRRGRRGPGAPARRRRPPSRCSTSSGAPTRPGRGRQHRRAACRTARRRAASPPGGRRRLRALGFVVPPDNAGDADSTDVAARPSCAIAAGERGPGRRWCASALDVDPVLDGGRPIVGADVVIVIGADWRGRRRRAAAPTPGLPPTRPPPPRRRPAVTTTARRPPPPPRRPARSPATRPTAARADEARTEPRLYHRRADEGPRHRRPRAARPRRASRTARPAATTWSAPTTPSSTSPTATPCTPPCSAPRPTSSSTAPPGPPSTPASPTPTGPSPSTPSAPATSPRPPAGSAPTSSHVSTDYVFDGTKPDAVRRVGRHRPAVGVRPVEARRRARGPRAWRPAPTIVRTSWVCGAGGGNMVQDGARPARRRPGPRARLRRRPARLPDASPPTWRRPCAGSPPARLPGHLPRHQPRAHHLVRLRRRPSSWRPAGSADQVRPSPPPSSTRPARRPRPANSVLDNLGLRLAGEPPLAHWSEPLERLVKELVVP